MNIGRWTFHLPNVFLFLRCPEKRILEKMAATVALKKEISKPKWLEKGGQGFSKNKRNMLVASRTEKNKNLFIRRNRLHGSPIISQISINDVCPGDEKKSKCWYRRDRGGPPLFFSSFSLSYCVVCWMENVESRDEEKDFFILIASRSRLPYLESTRVFFFVDSKKKKFFKSEGKKKDKMKSQKKTKQT